MTNQILFLLAAEERGGLFDFGATLPVVAIEFLLLMFVLNLILYTPLFTVMNQRNEYIISNLGKATELLQEAETLTAQYEEELAATKAKVQQELAASQKQQKQRFAQELVTIQSSIDNLLQKFLDNFSTKRTSLLEGLTTNVESLSKAIYSSVFAN